MPLDPKQLLTTQEAADELGISPGRVRQLVLERRLPAQKVGRDLLIVRCDLARVRNRRPGRPVGYRLSGSNARDPSPPEPALAGSSTGLIGGEWLVPSADSRPRRR